MLRDLAPLGFRTPWAILSGLRVFIKSVWDPTRSDIQAGINRLNDGVMARVDADRIRDVELLGPNCAPLSGGISRMATSSLDSVLARAYVEDMNRSLSDELMPPAPGNREETSLR